MRNVLELLERAAERMPEKRAVGDQDSSFRFLELQQAAKALAGGIGNLGKNQPIGVLADRNIRTVARILGVLYSGNYYVPLDPDLPAEKLQSILEETDMQLLLGPAEAEQSARAAGFQGVYISTLPSGQSLRDLPDVGGDDPLCMVYTSGSTGKPKGIVKSHGAYLDWLEAYCETFHLTENEIIGNQTPFFFDASSKDLYLMLYLGATLEIIPSKNFLFPMDLVDARNRRQISYLCWVPSALSIVAQLNPFSLVKPRFLRRVFFVGEVMPMKALNTWRRALPELEYVNLYGQSELAGVCCYHVVRGEYEDTACLPIGRPFSNTQVFLLDEQETLIREPNRTGELWIASRALALGYFKDPERTAHCFLQRDFGAGPVRCFRTGDLAHYNEHGELVFSARADDQIKHMGHRIEPGEIETAANGLEGVVRSACLYDEKKQRIVLFAEAKRSGSEIRRALKEKLSDYMVPGKVILLDKLPLSANGKLDRQSLRRRL